MNKNEYVIVNKSSIQRRMEELEVWSKRNERVGEYDSEGLIISELHHIISQSIPLIPENIKPLQELVDEGYDPYDSAHHLQVQRMLRVIQDYIANLKLDI